MIATAGMMDVGQRLFGRRYPRSYFPPQGRLGTVSLVQGGLGRFQVLKLAIQENVLLEMFPARWTDREMRVDVLRSRYDRPLLPNRFRQLCQFGSR